MIHSFSHYWSNIIWYLTSTCLKIANQKQTPSLIYLLIDSFSEMFILIRVMEDLEPVIQ